MKVIEFSDDELSLKKVGVDFLVFAPLDGQIDIGENRADGTDRFAHRAVDALAGIDIHLGCVGVGFDAIHRANFDARAVFDADARLGNDVRHNALQLAP